MAGTDEVFILKELSAIRDDLKCQLLALGEREEKLKEREFVMTQREALAENILVKLEKREVTLKNKEVLLLKVEECVATCYTSIEDCIEQKILHGQECNQLPTARLEMSYQHIKRENTRLKDSLTSVSSINKELRKQLDAEKVLSCQMKRHMTSLQARLACLKSDQTNTCKLGKERKDPQPEMEPNKPNTCSHLHKTLSSKEYTAPMGSQEKNLPVQLVYNLLQWVSKVLPFVSSSLPDVLCTTTFSLLAVLLPKMHTRYHYGCLQFICQVLLYTSSKTKLLMTSSVRRIGEVCAADIHVETSSSPKRFCSSSETKIRVLSCLVLLQTITRVDAINRSLQSLKYDLRAADVQAEFVLFGGIPALLPYLSSASKLQVQCEAALDIFVLLSSDSGLSHLLTKEWFSAVAGLFREGVFPPTQLEKISILLQRLSTFRQSRRLFEESEMLPLLQKLLLNCKDGMTSFFQLNISSTLNNLQSYYWPALQIAVENSCGGASSKEKARWLMEVTLQFIQQTNNVSSDDIMDYLSILMDQEFDMLIEDGSLESVSQQLLELWVKFGQGQLHHIQDFIRSIKKKNVPLLSELQGQSTSGNEIAGSPGVENKVVGHPSSDTIGNEVIALSTDDTLGCACSKDHENDRWTLVTRR